MSYPRGWTNLSAFGEDFQAASVRPIDQSGIRADLSLIGGTAHNIILEQSHRPKSA
jgi:hypothetical protein